jgi:hypothetical protein
MMVDGPLVHCFWRVLDRLDYWLTQTRLWVVYVANGTEPETADQRCWDRLAAAPTDGNAGPPLIGCKPEAPAIP